MTMNLYTAILERDGNLPVSLCPELDIAGQGKTVEEATANLKEAVDVSGNRRPLRDRAAYAQPDFSNDVRSRAWVK